MEHIEPPTLESWHDWLKDNHKQSESVWLVLAKKDSGLPTLDLEDVIVTALAFGWVDSLPNKVDDQRYKLRFSPRNPKSNWSAVNKARIARLQHEGRLEDAGREMVELAKSTGTWNALDDVENLVLQADLAEVFAEAPKAALENWEAFPRSVKRGILEWIYTAKRPATRAQRIAETVAKASKNERANQWRS
jgi:uncharacterized protein YdeI (YjbR/CyaY-like superfamily)